MANLFGNLLDKDNPVKKLQKEIEGMELKRNSLVSSIQHEIQMIKQKIDNTLHQIGSQIYSHYLDKEEIGDKLIPFFTEIDSFNKTIAEKEEKIKEILARYDEEIGMLKSHLSMSQPQAGFVPPNASQPAQPAQPIANMAFCGNCGKPYNADEDKFCMSCGQKLE